MNSKNFAQLFIICLLLATFVTRSSAAFFHHTKTEDATAATASTTTAAATVSDGRNCQQHPSQQPPTPSTEHCIVHCHMVVAIMPAPLYFNRQQGFDQGIKPTIGSFSNRSPDSDLRPPIV